MNPFTPALDAGQALAPRPRTAPAVLAACTDLQRRALARLMNAHEVRRARPAAMAAPLGAARDEADLSFPEDQAVPDTPDWHAWQARLNDEDFDPWDQAGAPSSRLSLRAMV